MKKITSLISILYIFIMLTSCNKPNPEIKMPPFNTTDVFVAKTPSHPDDNFSQKAYEKGKADANRELKKPVYALEIYGYPSSSRFYYKKQLMYRYGIELRSVAGCCIDDNIVGHAKGFNEVMEKAIKKRFGEDYEERIPDE